MTFLTYTLAVIETAALIGALVFATKAIKEKKNSNAKKNASVHHLSMLRCILF